MRASQGKWLVGASPQSFQKEKGQGCGGGAVFVPAAPRGEILELPGPKATPPGKSVLLTGLSEKMADIFRPH